MAPKRKREDDTDASTTPTKKPKTQIIAKLQSLDAMLDEIRNTMEPFPPESQALCNSIKNKCLQLSKHLSSGSPISATMTNIFQQFEGVHSSPMKRQLRGKSFFLPQAILSNILTFLDLKSHTFTGIILFVTSNVF